ncbi:hypothetical protein PISL3812_00123 [Talaromyces islandicus]|uniref:Uncharacterized protein n=1 Tax=Talaromyces islandicus TaxID=28573 RepID=A0A0U1LID7_TALIS|nr:hypothetical protein PISL3812_00123 [Talaromyces islandicus]
MYLICSPSLHDITPVRSAEERRSVYEKEFRVWESLYMRVTQGSDLSQTWFQIQPAHLHQLYFLGNSDLKLIYNEESLCFWNVNLENIPAYTDLSLCASTGPAMSNIAISYQALDNEEQPGSENATRSILGGLLV